MAVQAQYRSNVLLLNRNGEEDSVYSLQPQPGSGGGGGGGIFLDQSHMFLHDGGHVFPRKRAREAAGVGGGGPTTTTAAPPPPPPTTTTTAVGRGGGVTTASIATLLLNPNPTTFPFNNQSFSLQSQPPPPPPPPQLIDLSQLHHPSNISTGLRLSFSDQPQQQQQQNIAISHSFLTQDFASQIKRHRDELDHFLLAQGVELRHTLADKSQKHYRALLGAAEESITRRLREKETEVQKATRRRAELETRAAQLSVEVQVWQAKARAQEAAATSLQAQLQQAIVGAAAAPVRKADGGGGVGVEGQAAEDAESAYVDPDRVTAVTFCCGGGEGGGPGCKSCGKRVARVVLLPCRHLCLCSECDQFVQSCPVCLHVRNSSVEVFLC